jgi:hypothetical protein
LLKYFPDSVKTTCINAQTTTLQLASLMTPFSPPVKDGSLFAHKDAQVKVGCIHVCIYDYHREITRNQRNQGCRDGSLSRSPFTTEYGNLKAHPLLSFASEKWV